MTAIPENLFLSIIGSLVMALGVVVWFFFTRMQKKIDSVCREIGVMTKDYKDSVHHMENRLADKLDLLEREHHRTREDMSKLFTRVGMLEGFVHGVHKEYPVTKKEDLI